MVEKENLNLNYDSVTEIKALLDLMGLGPRKRWGQNFLINRGAREKIIRQLDLQEDERLWEIGPGLGAMTKMAASHPVDFTAFEIDPGYVEYLSRAMAPYPRFHLVSGDVLKTWEAERDANGAPDKVLGNLPYNAASAIIADFVEKNTLPSKLVLTVQSEMGERMTAAPGNKNYSSFSILCQSAFDVKDCGVLKPGSFYPVPRVSSRIVALTPHGRYDSMKNRELFQQLIRDIFVSRRKTIQNNLSAMSGQRFARFGKDLLFKTFEEEGINLTWRPEKI
ncbi:MAG: 16S rRNA (adenine(1518)-N(6)/adenine(1519)-N(6))-dimethyltransferase RsmA, partial [Spirochaetales bacterium]|nr:16S rRNA (adenine(1518)-N(6)/adenine(1519)-N(6))-dimethyltransferase RsmA [Spirochaetales bacterium]